MIIHIWEANNEACKAVDGCLQSIAKDYSHVKFARIQASAAGLSQKFKISGVPALLVYRSVELVSRFVSLWRRPWVIRHVRRRFLCIRFGVVSN